MYEFKFREKRRCCSWVVTEDTLHVGARQEPRHFFKRLAWYRRRIESLEEQAVIDDLTGLRNQRALWRELSRRASACSESSPLALVMVDFDLFKEINEGYGHAIGDAVLQRAAGCLRDAAPSPRLAFRYGGEEFVMLLPGDEAEGREVAEHVRADIARQNGHLPAVTVSCGVAQLDSPAEPWVALDRADSALRDAKRAGRNRVVVASRRDSGGSAYLVEEIEHETARRAALALAVATLEVRDRNTADHSDDVLTLCESIGRELGLDGRELERLMAGAQLHDVGKVAVPSEILNKPGPLDDTEWSVIREHTVIGERILRSVPEMAEVATIVRHSHEHWDGSGYPDGLAGEQIPLASRVILCADAFHAIRSDRPYRAGRPAADAIAEVRKAAGVQLDPTVVDALVRVASDVRRGAAGVSLTRRGRLVALLATLAIGSGSAVAAIPDLRDAVRSIFGAGTVETHVLTTTPTDGFDFGPLGATLTLPPAARERGAAERASAARTAARRGDRRGTQPGSSNPNGERGAFAPSGTSRETLQTPGIRGGAGPRATPTPTSPPAPPTGGPAPAPNRPDTGATADPVTQPDPVVNKTKDKGADHPGRGLGHTLPTPRRPAVPPGHSDDPGHGRPDPPAIGRNLGPGNGKGKNKG
jgi:diguanylate cyclase (GGDEF)-like protein/putative nucleotidyltransferase with HDIG domain